MYEYKVVEHKKARSVKMWEDDMNKLGLEGWELVAIAGGDLEMPRSVWRKKKG